jgi:hypothetical protein
VDLRQSRVGQDNPYLGEMVQAPPHIPKPAAPEQLQSSLVPRLQQSSPMVERTDSDQAHQSGSELLKPRDDAKYFKQLKRF